MQCYLYFPAKDQSDVFRIGAAVSTSGPAGPYKPEQNFMPNTYSVDPAVFKDKDGSHWMIWGGEWGGELLAPLPTSKTPFPAPSFHALFVC